jgi:hypothetical protein
VCVCVFVSLRVIAVAGSDSPDSFLLA